MLLPPTAAAISDRRRQVAGLPAITPEQLGQIDFANKSTLTELAVVVSGVCISLISAIVILRLVTRRKTIGRFFLDDGLITLAALFTLVLCSITIAATRYGLGQHVWNLNLKTIVDNLEHCIQLLYVGNIFYALAVAFTKLSIVSSYVHIFSPYGTMQYILYGTAAVTVMLLVASVPATIFQCTPVDAAWHFGVEPQTHCYQFVNFLYASTAVNIITDLILCILPIPMFWKLQLPAKQKFLVSLLFFLGGFACIASIIRIAYLHLLDGSSVDVTYNIVSSLMWTIAECTIGIVCVSLPSLRPLFAVLIPSVFRSQHSVGSRHNAIELGSSSKSSNGPGPDQIELVSKGRKSRSSLDVREIV